MAATPTLTATLPTNGQLPDHQLPTNHARLLLIVKEADRDLYSELWYVLDDKQEQEELPDALVANALVVSLVELGGCLIGPVRSLLGDLGVRDGTQELFARVRLHLICGRCW